MQSLFEDFVIAVFGVIVGLGPRRAFAHASETAAAVYRFDGPLFWAANREILLQSDLAKRVVQGAQRPETADCSHLVSR